MPSQVHDEDPSKVDLSRVDRYTQSFLLTLTAASVPPLETLMVASRVFETVAENLLDHSAHGAFERNKQGLLHPLECLYQRLRDRRPPAGYLLGPNG